MYKKRYSSLRTNNTQKKLKNKTSMFILFIFLIFVFSIITNFSFGKNEVKTTDLVVSSNDTIWNISKEVCNKSNENLNIQNVVNVIKRINYLAASHEVLFVLFKEKQMSSI